MMGEFELQTELFQPWSTFVMKTQLPSPILEKMLKITDEIIANVESAKPWGHNLVGQIEDELLIEVEILERENLMAFFLDVVRQFVIHQTLQTDPLNKENIINEEWYTQMKSMWVISQKDNEYNPIHVHTDCDISTVMYLKIPEYLSSRKPDRNVDGALGFVNNTANDQTWGTPLFLLQPEVGDFFIFPASQQHFVYPFRTADGKGERRSVSFNAAFTTKTEQDILRKQQEEQEAI